MLGSVTPPGYWRWAAHGKHRVAGDYFRLGDDLPLLLAFGNWVDQGYRILSAMPNAPAGYRSWRFWARGGAKGQLVSGLVRDSADRHGRPFPLLLVGTGPLSGWEEQWDLVPLACEGSWNQMERLCTRGYEAIRELEADIHKMRGPSPEWSVFQAQREEVEKSAGTSGGTTPLQRTDLEQKAMHLCRQPEIFIPLSERPTDDQFALVSVWHSLLRAEAEHVPNVVFMGGSQEAAFMVLLQRPLRPDDFVELWSQHTGEGEG